MTDDRRALRISIAAGIGSNVFWSCVADSVDEAMTQLGKFNSTMNPKGKGYRDDLEVTYKKLASIKPKR